MSEKPKRSVGVPRTLTIAGLLVMLVLAGFALNGFTYESGDDVYRYFLAEAIAGAVTTVLALWWLIGASRKGGAIAALVVSIAINPIWLFLAIRAFG